MLPVAALSACLEPARERALRDEEVGLAEADGTSVVVSHGHAAIRSLDGEQLVLWQSAPGVEFELTRDSAGELELSLWNTMPAARLVQVEGPFVSVEPLAREVATRASFRLEFSAAGSHRFRMSDPESERMSPFRFALMSDVQEAIDSVSDLYQRMNQDPEIEFLLGAGDLTQRGSFAELARFEDELLALDVPYYTTLGNHELGTSPPPYQETFGRGSFSFVHRGARFTLLDSASATLDPLVISWLEGWLEDGAQQFHAVGMHVPPIDPVGTRNGSFASRNEANALLAKLLSGGVDLTLYGHLHSYFRFENGGIPARISGGGGAIPERFDRVGRHYLTIDVEPELEAFESRVVQIEGD